MLVLISNVWNGQNAEIPTIPIASMYGISTYIYHKNQPNLGKYAIHGCYGIGDGQRYLSLQPKGWECGGRSVEILRRSTLVPNPNRSLSLDLFWVIPVEKMIQQIDQTRIWNTSNHDIMTLEQWKQKKLLLMSWFIPGWRSFMANPAKLRTIRKRKTWDGQSNFSVYLMEVARKNMAFLVYIRCKHHT